MPCLARTPEGYINTYNIKKGMTLLANGKWITAESNATEIPCYQVTFSNNIHTYVKDKDIIPKACTIPLKSTAYDKADFVKGYNVQNPFKFPLKIRDMKLVQGFMKLNMEIPICDNLMYHVRHADLSYGYSNNTLNDMANGILYRNINIERCHHSRIVYYRELKDESMFILHLASIHTTEKEMLVSTYHNLMTIDYAFNPTKEMMKKAITTHTEYYTNEYPIVSVVPSICNALENQEIDINNFSTI